MLTVFAVIPLCLTGSTACEYWHRSEQLPRDFAILNEALSHPSHKEVSVSQDSDCLGIHIDHLLGKFDRHAVTDESDSTIVYIPGHAVPLLLEAYPENAAIRSAAEAGRIAQN